MNILFLSAQNFHSEIPIEAEIPVCLTEFSGKPLIELLVSNTLRLESAHRIFAFGKHDLQYWNLDCIASQLDPYCNVISVEKPTAGALCTALLAIKYINSDDELLIISVNEVVNEDLAHIISDFRKRELDAGVLIFPSIHPRYAFVRLDDEQKVIEVAEKRPISKNAITGIFWFSTGKVFVRAAMESIRKDSKVRDAFYISSTLNEIILEHGEVGIFSIDKSKYLPVKTKKQKDLLEIRNNYEN